MRINKPKICLLVLTTLALSACGGGGGGDDGGGSPPTTTPSYTVTATVTGSNGSITPASQSIKKGQTATLTLAPDTGYHVDSVSGCGNGTLSGTTYTTGAVTADCTVSASFKVNVAAPTLSATAYFKAVELNWAAVPDADHYNLCYATEPVTDFANCSAYAGGTLELSVTSPHSVTGLTNGAKYYFRVAAVTAAGDAGPASNEVSATPHGINDTGITECGDYAYPDTTHNNDVVCADAGATQTDPGIETANGNNPVPAGQDALYGRDNDPATNSPDDGPVGFSYTKLSATDASPLAIQTSNWADTAGSETNGTHWGCVRDNVTGLIWEAKLSDANSPRYVGYTYSWLNTNASTNGGWAGTADGGSCGADQTLCDTQSYVAYVNTQQLCGFSDWRMPSSEELLSLINKGKRAAPMANVNWLGPTESGGHWSASPDASNGNNAWNVSFSYGYEGSYHKVNGGHVRLVRGGQ